MAEQPRGGQHQSGPKRTRREVFLGEMDQVVPWPALETLLEPVYPHADVGRPAYPLQLMLRIHLLQNWFGYSDPGMEEALYETPLLCRFAGIAPGGRIPDETTILHFRRRLEQHGLGPKFLAAINAHLQARGLFVKRGTIVDATILHAATSTKNKQKSRDPAMHATKKGNQWYFGLKAHIGVDADSGLVHTVTTTAANVSDVTETSKLLHGQEEAVNLDAGYTGVEKRPEMAAVTAAIHVAVKRSRLDGLMPEPVREAWKALETLKARLRARVEHPFRVVKRQFGYVKARFRGLDKNHVQIQTLFGLANLWLARKRLLANTGEVRLQAA